MSIPRPSARFGTVSLTDTFEDLSPYLARSSFPLEDVWPTLLHTTLYQNAAVVGLPVRS